MCFDLFMCKYTNALYIFKLFYWPIIIPKGNGLHVDQNMERNCEKVAFPFGAVMVPQFITPSTIGTFKDKPCAPWTGYWTLLSMSLWRVGDFAACLPACHSLCESHSSSAHQQTPSSLPGTTGSIITHSLLILFHCMLCLIRLRSVSCVLFTHGYEQKKKERESAWGKLCKQVFSPCRKISGVTAS